MRLNNKAPLQEVVPVQCYSSKDLLNEYESCVTTWLSTSLQEQVYTLYILYLSI